MTSLSGERKLKETHFGVGWGEAQGLRQCMLSRAVSYLPFGHERSLAGTLTVTGSPLLKTVAKWQRLTENGPDSGIGTFSWGHKLSCG